MTMTKRFSSIALSLTMVAGLAAAAGAQTVPAPPPPQQTTTQQTTTPDGQTTTTVTSTYVDSKCGAWHADNWVPNGTCDASDMTAYKHQRLAGTITAVQGHLVTIQQTDKTVVVNDQPALIDKMSGRVAVGRQVVAHGYWDKGTFYATALTTNDAAVSGM
jgi:hypothetical protein